MVLVHYQPFSTSVFLGYQLEEMDKMRATIAAVRGDSPATMDTDMTIQSKYRSVDLMKELQTKLLLIGTVIIVKQKILAAN